MGGDLNEKLYILHLLGYSDPRARLELTFEFEYDSGDALMDDFHVTLRVRFELKEEYRDRVNGKIRNLRIFLHYRFLFLSFDHTFISTLILNG